MVFASNSGNLAAARMGLNISSSSLRTWHERLLFGSSTQQLAAGAVQYQAHAAFPAYRSTPVVEQVSAVSCTESLPILVDPLVCWQSACDFSCSPLESELWLSTHSWQSTTSNHLQVAYSHIYFHILVFTRVSCLQVYFSSGCLRSSASTCLNASNVYYPMTNNGLNLLTYYYMDQADLLVDDEDADVTYTNSRYGFIQAVRFIPVLAHANSRTHVQLNSWMRAWQCGLEWCCFDSRLTALQCYVISKLISCADGKKCCLCRWLLAT